MGAFRLPELGKAVPSIFFFFCFFIFFIIGGKMAVGNCKKCGKAIVRAANLTEYKGAKYHSGCFNCAGCGANITGPEGFINHQEKLYCHACYEKDIAEKCKKCQKSLADGGVRFQDEPYHKECFLCGGCGTKLGEGKFFVDSNTPYCANCHKVIADQPFVKDEEGNFCADCADS